jgi:lysophospholipase L1-like esterase
MIPDYQKHKALRGTLRFSYWLLPALISLFVMISVYTSTLEKNGQWTSTKTKLEKGVMGAWSFVLTRTALAGNALNLGTWHGFQEVFLKSQPDADQLRFRFRLAEEAALVVYLASRGDTLTAIRLSRNPEYPDALIEIVDQEFMRNVPMDFSVTSGVWHQFSGRLDDEGLRITLVGDGDTANCVVGDVENLNVLGFRGYEGSTLVDEIVLKNGNAVVFKESFAMDFSKWPWIFLLLGAGILVFWLMTDLQRFFHLAIINIALITILLTGFYLVRGQYLYPKEWMILWNSASTSIATEAEVAVSVGSILESEMTSPVQKVMFLGSSQTWGAGASSEDLTFVSRFEYLVNLNGTMHITAINTGISGVNSNTILEKYKDQWIKGQPDITVINLSLNDAGNPLFRSNLHEIVLLNESAGIQTVLVCEPLAIIHPYHLANHRIMKDLAEVHGLLIIDPQPILNELSDSGFLFWDFVHLTNAGHRLVAQMLAVELIPLLAI